MIGDRSVEAWLTDKIALDGASVGFVPTMGNLHASHGLPLEHARGECDVLRLSIFVNPTQFNDPTDLARYPRTLEADLNLARRHGVDRVPLPIAEDLYPDQYTSRMSEAVLCITLCGRAHPGQFDGVLSVERTADIAGDGAFLVAEP